MVRRLLLISTFTVAVLLSCPLSSWSQEVEDEREYSYVPGTPNGPEHWAELNHNWTSCNVGKMQSPIDLQHERVEVVHELGKLRRSYRPSQAVVKNRGHDIMLEWTDGAGSMWLANGSEPYVLRQLHWHSPSEHTINGKSFAMELHMVHTTSAGGIAVVGILYELGRPDPFLADLEEQIAHVKDREDHKAAAGVIDPRLVRRGSRKYFRYIGSLTTPPCTENVTWTIVNKVRTVSREQVKLLRDAVNDNMERNARPTQDLYERTVKFYRPERKDRR